jgi:hypothetical protein
MGASGTTAAMLPVPVHRTAQDTVARLDGMPHALGVTSHFEVLVEPRELTPHEKLAARVVAQALADATEPLSVDHPGRRIDARRWLLYEFPASVWAAILPDATVPRVRQALA